MAIEDFYRGDTVQFNITLKDSQGMPIDINGATIYFTMKLSTKEGDPGDLQKVVTTHTYPDNGQSQVVLSHDDTKNLEPTKYFYDFQITMQTGEVYTFDAGKVNVLPDVTLS
jgi:hypothetical protein